MKLKDNIKSVIIEVVCILYALLFVYAAMSKFLEFENFQAQLGQSPILGAYTGMLSYIVIAVELLLALILAIPKTKVRLPGLYASFGLMIMFTVYIVIILNFSSTIPCSCGGVLENMNWNEHLIFNIFFILLVISGIVLSSVNGKKAWFKLVIITMIGSLIITLLYVRTEYVMQKENPFVRRFTPGSSKNVSETKLHNNTLYFAGADHNSIYIGDPLAPLHIFKYDSTLKKKQHYKIQLDRDDFPFRSVQVKVVPPYFFVIDGTIPVIYRGKISDWKAKVLMKDNGYYFSKTVVIDSSQIAFRTQEEKSAENILGLFSFESGLKSSLKSSLFPDLLQKQVDGLFDTDGMMNYNPQSKTFVYLYYYRNQFIVTNDKLQLKYRGNTIDTTKTANIKPVFIKEKGQRKLASSGGAVNKLSTLRDNTLFVNSSLRGEYEAKEMWDTASIVDVYDISSKSYISSLYIYKVGVSKMKDMITVDNNLYVIVGKNLQRYELNKDLKMNNNKSISADSRGKD